MADSSPLDVSVVLNDMGGTALAVYGFRSWMLQDFTGSYEVILNLFNDKRAAFEKLMEEKPRGCQVVINEFPPPKVFNISAANNLGLHFARGKYVVWCNADVIMPSYYLRRLFKELEGHDWHYLFGARWNLTVELSLKVGPVEEYSRGKNFDSILNWIPGNGVQWGPGMSPWVMRRDTAMAIGGFDSRIYVHEDTDLGDRVFHYCKRKGLQDITPMIASYDMHGIHLYHPPGRLHVMSAESWKVLSPRQKRLWDDPQSTEDCVSTPLGSLAELTEIMSASAGAVTPDDSKAPSAISKAAKRLANAWRVLIYGNF